MLCQQLFEQPQVSRTSSSASWRSPTTVLCPDFLAISNRSPLAASYVALSPLAEVGASGPTCVHRAQALKAGAPPVCCLGFSLGVQGPARRSRQQALRRPLLLACPCHRSFRSALLDGWMGKGGACVLTEPPASVGRRTESGSNTDSGRVLLKFTGVHLLSECLLRSSHMPGAGQTG